MSLFSKNLYPLWLPQHKKCLNISFLEWFIGFSEGLGIFFIINNKGESIEIPSFFIKNNKFINKKKHDSFNTNTNPLYLNFDLDFDLDLEEFNTNFLFLKNSFINYKNIGFKINHSDPQLLYKIRKNLGFGKIKRYKFKTKNLQNINYYSFVISNISSTLRLFSLFKNQFILNHTIKKYWNWINLFLLILWKLNNKHYLFKNNNRFLQNMSIKNNNHVIKKNSILFFNKKQHKDFFQKSFFIKNNAWFSGIIDSIGCFNVLSNPSQFQKKYKSHNIISFYVFFDLPNLFYSFNFNQNLNFLTLQIIKKNNTILISNYNSHSNIYPSLNKLEEFGEKKNFLVKKNCKIPEIRINIKQRFLFNININLLVQNRFYKNQNKNNDFYLFFFYMNKYKIKSKKNITYLRFKKIWNRLNDLIIRKKRSLKKLNRLINKI